MGETADAVERRIEAEAAQPSDDPEVIRAQIEQTRAEMSETIDAIQERLTPENIKEQAMDTVKDATESAKEAARAAVQEAFTQTKDALRSATIGRVEDMANYASYTAKSKGNGLMSRIRENPVPAALAAIGIGWLLFKGGDDNDDYDYDQYATYRSQKNRYSGEYASYTGQYGRSMDDERQGGLHRATEKVGDVAEGAKDAVTGAASNVAGAVTGAASNVADAVTGAASSVQHRASDMADGAGDRAADLRYWSERRARRAKGGFNQMLRQNPMAVGAIAAALGTAIGLAAPGTDKERELMGEMRDNFMDKAQTFAQEKFEQVAGVAQETMDVVKDEAKTAAENVKHTAQQEARHQGLTQGSQGQSQGNQGSSAGQGSNTGQSQSNQGQKAGQQRQGSNQGAGQFKG
jgi:uncharacterized protein YjbJ (UPF0337 family)